MSITVTVMYPNTSGSKFDLDYYLKTHGPLVERLWRPHGLRSLKVVRGVATPDPNTPPPWRIMALIEFSSLDQFKAAVKAAGKEVMGDISNFTDVTPAIQINENLA
jgi:uncharacterized protein (TIGR02118 family)